jgi:hypothetical protein
MPELSASFHRGRRNGRASGAVPRLQASDDYPDEYDRQGANRQHSGSTPGNFPDGANRQHKGSTPGNFPDGANRQHKGSTFGNFPDKRRTYGDDHGENACC